MSSHTATVDAAASLESLSGLVGTFAARGAKPAVIAYLEDRADTLSYERLAEVVEQVAHGLHALGIGRGDFVALWAPNGPDWIAAYFGIVCAGAAAIPLDQQSGVDAVAVVLAHAEPKLLLTTVARLAELGTRAPTQCVAFDSDSGEWQQLRAAPRSELPDVSASDLASLVYTSGTTGTPKGVPLTHRNLLANANALASAELIDSRDRVLLPLPLHHTYPFTVGLLMTLHRGATVILPAGLSGPQIAAAAQTAGATALLAVPRLCTALWDSVLAGVRTRGRAATRLFTGLLAASVAVRRLTGLHLGRRLFGAVHRRLGGELAVIGCGGAKLDPDLAWKLEGLGWTVLTGYGLTETSPVLTFNDRHHARLGTEGRALSGVTLEIAAEPGQADGEIRARGPNVFAGYWNNAAATTAAFTPDGWFRTGDLGFIDAAGYLHVVGRSKELIVLADGKKVFPEDLEKRYATASLLREVAILEHGGGLIALVVPDEQALRERGTLREAALLREQLEDVTARLPPYQRIGDYRVTREPLPRTQLGKLKRHLLADLYRQAATAERRAEPTAPTPEDSRLLESERGKAIWRWLDERYPDAGLTLDTSPQLDLHVDSLGWVTLTLEIEQRFGVALTGEAVSRILTLRDLLREIEAAPPAAVARASTSTAYVPPGPLLRAAGALLYLALRLTMRVAFRIEVEGTERLPAGGAFVLTPNHASYLDPLVLAAALPWRQLRNTHWAGWVGVMYTSALRRFLSRAAQVFPIDPDRDLAGTISTARALLEHGHSIVWFPEGRRSPTGEIEPFQLGIGLLLRDTHASAVPVALSGTFAAWSKHRRLPRVGARLKVTFGTSPQTPDAQPERDAEHLRAELERAVRNLAAGTYLPKRLFSTTRRYTARYRHERGSQP